MLHVENQEKDFDNVIKGHKSILTVGAWGCLCRSLQFRLSALYFSFLIDSGAINECLINYHRIGKIKSHSWSQRSPQRETHKNVV